MNTKSSRIAKVALVALLAVSLTLPGIALAQPQAKNLRAQAAQAAQKAKGASEKAGLNQPTDQLKNRVANVLAARAKRFKAAEANLTKKITRLESIVASLTQAGADAAKLAEVTAKIESAKINLADAKAQEIVVAGLFNEIAEQTTSAARRAKFVEAKKAGRVSVNELKLARKDIKAAAHMLRAIVKEMKAAS